MEEGAMAAKPSKRTRTSTAARSWSNLSSEIGGVILSRMPSLADRARFRSVCRQWRHAARQQWRLLPPALPWLTTSYKCVFVGFPDGARLSLPVHVHARSWEAFDRWILCRARDGDGDGDGDGHLLLRNPLLSEETSMVLPPARIGRVVVCPGGQLVAAMCHIDGRQTVAFCRPGARSWSPAQRPEGVARLLDIALHRGLLYALYDRGTLCAYDLGDGNPGGSVRLCIVGSERPKTEAEARFLRLTERERYYLVPSPCRGGRLLLVRSKWGESFDVFEADDASGQWSEVTSLADDEALFLGAHGSRGLQTASRYGGGAVRGNRIYFADETYSMRISFDNPVSLGVYDMDSKNRSGIGLPRGSFVDDCKPTGSWLFPSTADL